MSDPATLFWLGALVVIAFVDLVVVINLWRSSRSIGAKWAWTLVVVLLPVLGWVVWGIAGPRGMARPPSSPEQSK